MVSPIQILNQIGAQLYAGEQLADFTSTLELWWEENELNGHARDTQWFSEALIQLMDGQKTDWIPINCSSDVMRDFHSFMGDIESQGRKLGPFTFDDGTVIQFKWKGGENVLMVSRTAPSYKIDRDSLNIETLPPFV